MHLRLSGPGSGLAVQDKGFGRGLGFRVWGSGFRVPGLGSKGYSIGFGVASGCGFRATFLEGFFRQAGSLKAQTPRLCGVYGLGTLLSFKRRWHDFMLVIPKP